MPIILITGAGGMIGRSLIKYFTAKGYVIRTLVRDKNKADGINSFFWNYLNEEIDLNVFEKLDYIFNLAGANVGKRWTLKYKKEIYDSRIMSTDFLFNTIKNKNIRIKKIISASGTGFYGDSAEINRNENSPTGNDFLSMVCRDWENSAKQFNNIKAPVCILRIGVVISKEGGFVKRISTPIKFFAGMHIGSGNQIISWISSNDLCRLFEHVIDKNLVGVYNATASNPLALEQIENTIAQFYHRKIWLPHLPPKVLKMLFGEMSSTILGSCHTTNAKVKTTGFVFQNEDFIDALSTS